MNNYKLINRIVLGLVSVGALNWLLVALLKVDLVQLISDTLKISGFDSLLYTLIGASGIWIGILALMGKVNIR